MRGQDAINIIVRPSTHFLCSCHFPSRPASYTPPRRPSCSCSATFHFCALHPSADSQHGSPCQPSPLPFPPGLGSATEKWSRRKSQFDLRMNYNTAIRPLSSRLLLSIKIRLLHWKLKRHTVLTCRTNCAIYVGLIYIADITITRVNR